MKRAAVPSIVALLLAVGACEGGTDDDPSSAGGTRTATCTDAAGDGGAADLTAVELTESGEGLRAVFTLAGPLDTATGTQVLSLLVSSRDAKTAKQFGAKWIDGTPLVFVFDFGSGGQQIVQAEPQVDGATVDLAFPPARSTGSATPGTGGPSPAWPAPTSTPARTPARTRRIRSSRRSRADGGMGQA